MRDSELSYLVKSEVTRPYCHYCRHLCDCVVLVSRVGGNPRRACRCCVETGLVDDADFPKEKAIEGFNRLALKAAG
jgi:hypothetical protein